MSRPVAMLPTGANDARPSRPDYFTNKGSAIAHATRCARHNSPTGTYRAVEFVTDCYQAVEGGNGFRITLGPLDWEVHEIAAAEVTRKQQAGIRAAVDRCLEKAKSHDAAVLLSRGRALKGLHEKMAREERDAAREIELRLLVSGVRPAAALIDDSEPRFSAERDSRAEAL